MIPISLAIVQIIRHIPTVLAVIETQVYLRTVIETMAYLGIQVHEVITY